MGRYISGGVAVKLRISKQKKYYSFSKCDLVENRTEILEQLNRYIDVSKYRIVEYDDGFELNIDEDYVEKNIYDLVKEINPLLNCDSYFLYNLLDKDYKRDLSEFSEDKYPLHLHKYTEEDTYKNECIKHDLCGHYCIKSDYGYIVEDTPFYSSERWLFNYDMKFVENVCVDIDFIPLWSDYDKFASEDEDKMLQIMNTMSKSYFNSKLSKNFLFYISG